MDDPTADATIANDDSATPVLDDDAPVDGSQQLRIALTPPQLAAVLAVLAIVVIVILRRRGASRT
jgi:hypothetical protein